MRLRTVLAMVIALLVVAVAVSLILLTRVDVPVEAPSASHEGKITILENGDAQMEITTTVSMPQLNSLYREVIENDGEDAFKEAYRQSIENEYKALTDLDISITDSKIENGPNGELKISVNATAPQVGKFNSAKNLWEVDIRPPNENVATDYILTQMIFARMWLKSQPGEQQLELVSELPIRLPSDATILNKDNLSASRWRIDFGGGMYREASLSVNEGQREVLLTERILVTEQAPVFSQITREDFPNYRAFTVEYNLPGVSMSSAIMSASGNDGSSDSNEDWSWRFNRSFSDNFSENFHGERDTITADLKVDANPSFEFTFYIGWDIDWAWDIPPWELDWFETYLEVNPAFRADMAVDITGYFQDNWEKPLGEEGTLWEHWVHVQIGPIPVEIQIRIDAWAGVEANAAGDFHFDAGLDASTRWKLGMRYDGGWQNISDSETDFVYSGPNIEVGAEASVTAFAKLRIGAYLYGDAGPYIDFKPKVRGSLTYSPNSWSLDTGFEIIAGVDFGVIGDWVGLSNREISLFDWMTSPSLATAPSLATGTWRPNNAKPTLTLENAPSDGPVGDNYVFDVIYADADIDPPSYVRIYIDGKADNMTYENGDYENGALYRYTWVTNVNDAGPHAYYFEAQDIQATARLPASGTLTGPTLWLRWVDVSAGSTHSLGISEDGALWAWGSNNHYQLGLGWVETTDRTSPARVGYAPALTDISAGGDFSLGLDYGGTLWSWGDYRSGRLGVGATGWESSSPTRVSSSDYWTAASAGGAYSLAIRSDGTLWAWGFNADSQLGLGGDWGGWDPNQFRWSPVQVGTANDWAAISAGGSHSLGLRSDGSLWAWGSNYDGELGLGDNWHRTSPVQVGTDNNWVAVSAGGIHSLGIRSDGTLWAWGGNTYGQLGLGDYTSRSTPVQVGTATNWVAISADWHSLAIRSDGTLWAWGLNNFGQLGLGDTANRTSPARVGENNNWEKIDAGADYSLGILSDGSLWAWGYNANGQLGLGDTTDRTSPVQVGKVW